MVEPSSPLLPVAVVATMVASALPVALVALGSHSRILGRLEVPPCAVGILALGGAGLVGYALVFAHLLDPRLGRGAVLAVWAGAAASLALPGGRRRMLAALADPELRLPAIAMALVAFCHGTLLFGVATEPVTAEWSWLTQAKSTWIGSTDNQFPLWLARRLAEGQPPGFLSHRPPLQAGLVLIPLPLWQALQALSGSEVWLAAGYQTFATWLQCAWVPAVWSLARQLGAGRARSLWLVAALTPSYFLFLNGVFVWPKLLAASFALGCFALLLAGEAGERAPGRCAAAALLAGLALLTHTGTATALLAFCLVLATPRFFPGAANALRATAIALALLAPWSLTVQTLSPGPNPLAKVHLAGVPLGEAPEQGLLVAIRTAYAERSPGSLLEEKGTKLLFSAGIGELAPAGAPGSTFFGAARNAQLQRALPSLDVLCVGFAVVAIGCLGTGGRRRRARRLARVLGTGLLGLLLWILLFLSPPILQVGPYPAMLLLFVGLGLAIFELPRPWCIAIFAVHGGFGLAVILFGGFGSIQSLAVTAAGLWLGALGVLALGVPQGEGASAPG